MIRTARQLIIKLRENQRVLLAEMMERMRCVYALPDERTGEAMI